MVPRIAAARYHKALRSSAKGGHPREDVGRGAKWGYMRWI